MGRGRVLPGEISGDRDLRSRNVGTGSESNTTAGTIQIKKACQKSWQIAPKNEDISKSVSSIDSGAIFRPRSGQDLPRNVVVVSGYAF